MPKGIHLEKLHQMKYSYCIWKQIMMHVDLKNSTHLSSLYQLLSAQKILLISK